MPSRLPICSKQKYFFRSRWWSLACGTKRLFYNIVLCVKKQKNWWVGHFTTLSGHFLANYINIFHKIELPTIILMCLTCLNLVWIKSYDIFSFPVFYHFVKKKYWKFMTHKWSSWDNFWPFFGQLHENISQKRGSDGHFEMLSVSKS